MTGLTCRTRRFFFLNFKGKLPTTKIADLITVNWCTKVFFSLHQQLQKAIWNNDVCVCVWTSHLRSNITVFSYHLMSPCIQTLSNQKPTRDDKLKWCEPALWICAWICFKSIWKYLVWNTTLSSDFEPYKVGWDRVLQLCLHVERTESKLSPSQETTIQRNNDDQWWEMEEIILSRTGNCPLWPPIFQQRD